MAANTLPSGIGDLFVLAERIEEGLKVHGPWLLQGAMPVEEFSELLDSARRAEAAFSIARASKAAAAKTFAAADKALTSWLAKARLVAMLALGSKWSESWIATGFTHRRTNVPKRIAPRIELCRRLATFFAEQPNYEVGFASVTASAGKALHRLVVGSTRNVRTATVEASVAKHARDAAEKQLRRKMHVVVMLLPCSLGKGDPRWLAFGLNQPNAKAPPKRKIESAGIEPPLTVEFDTHSESGRAKIAAA